MMITSSEYPLCWLRQCCVAPSSRATLATEPNCLWPSCRPNPAPYNTRQKQLHYYCIVKIKNTFAS